MKRRALIKGFVSLAGLTAASSLFEQKLLAQNNDTLARALPSGKNYYVDSNRGSDSNDGTSQDKAWKSISRVNDTDFQPGDIVNFVCGSKFTQPLKIFPSGTASKPITFRSFGKGAAPVFSSTRSFNLIVCKGSYLIIDGFKIIGAREAAISIDESYAEYNIIRNCDISYSAIGVSLLGKFTTLEHNNIHDINKMVKNDWGGDDDYGAIGILIQSQNAKILNNTVEQCTGPSYDYGTDGSAFELYDNVDGAVIDGNYTSGNNRFMEVGGQPGSAKNVIVANNKAIHNNGRFLAFNLSGKFATNVNNFRLINNIVSEGKTREELIEFWDGPPLNSSQLVEQNNKFI